MAEYLTESGGLLTYPADGNGYKIPDFSYVGYQNMGADALPVHGVDYTTHSTVTGLSATSSEAAGNNNFNLIQAAIDAAEADGAVDKDNPVSIDIPEGTYYIHNDSAALTIEGSGIILRGAGADTTRLIEYGSSGNPYVDDSAMIRIGDSTTVTDKSAHFSSGSGGTTWNITTAVVNVGDMSFDVDNATGLAVNDEIIIDHPCTSAWVTAVEDGGVISDTAWQVDEVPVRYWRTITDITSNTITVDAPVYYSLVKATSQCIVYKYTQSYIENSGIENITVDVDRNSGDGDSLTNSTLFTAVRFFNVKNGFARDVNTLNFRVNGIEVVVSRNITMLDCEAINPHNPIVAAFRYNFSCDGGQNIFYENCLADYGRHNFITNGWGCDSGIVYLNCTSKNSYSNGVEAGHQRWSHGFLYDQLTMSEDGTPVTGSFWEKQFWSGNHNDNSNSHGWTGCTTVVWRCVGRSSPEFQVLHVPPTGLSWEYFSTGNWTSDDPNFTLIDDGYEANEPGAAGEGLTATTSGEMPTSLYEAQLTQRLNVPDVNLKRSTLQRGSKAFMAMGYL